MPFEEIDRRYLPPYDVLAGLAALEDGADEVDDDLRRPLENELLRRFTASPEARVLDAFPSCRLVVDFAANYLGSTIARLDESGLRQILFDIIPRKVSIDASEARSVIEENRAFFAFLKREFAFERADACLRVLDNNAVDALARALSDSGKFGMAKSFFMGGQSAGFDMETKAGIEAWMNAVNASPMAASSARSPLWSPRKANHPAAEQKKKNARKAARKARKKNR
jgi:hypothetical protein